MWNVIRARSVATALLVLTLLTATAVLLGGCEEEGCLTLPCPLPIALILPVDLDGPFQVQVEGSDGSTFQWECRSSSGCGGGVGVPIDAESVRVTLQGEQLTVSRSFTPSYGVQDVGNCSTCLTARVEFGPVP